MRKESDLHGKNSFVVSKNLAKYRSRKYFIDHQNCRGSILKTMLHKVSTFN